MTPNEIAHEMRAIAAEMVKTEHLCRAIRECRQPLGGYNWAEKDLHRNSHRLLRLSKMLCSDGIATGNSLGNLTETGKDLSGTKEAEVRIEGDLSPSQLQQAQGRVWRNWDFHKHLSRMGSKQDVHH